MLAGTAWGILYYTWGEQKSSLIPLMYTLFSFLSLIYFAYSRRFVFFRFSQLLNILLLPVALMVSLGGFVNGSAVILWSLICPLGAMLFNKESNARWWFFAFIVLVIGSGIIQPWLRTQNNLTAGQINFFFVMNLGGVGGLIFLMVYYFVEKKNFFQDRSEALLLNILPKEIVEKLKEEQKTIVEHFDGASILFADIVNFTPISSTYTPARLLELLNEVFLKFDTLVEKYGIEKIKTIGDSYMVASGVPCPRTDHALVLTRMAIEMRDYVRSHEFSGTRLQFRFGINSGPVTAGVIGKKKFSYDLWGEAVNIASRMESHGQANTIQITQATYDLIKNEIPCVDGGMLIVKGKGEMRVWRVA
jgi:guanylate cyclase